MVVQVDTGCHTRSRVRMDRSSLVRKAGVILLSSSTQDQSATGVGSLDRRPTESH